MQVPQCSGREARRQQLSQGSLVRKADSATCPKRSSKHSKSGVVPGRTEIMGFLKRNYNSSWIPRVLRKFVGPSDFRERNALPYREA
jgi:hypothetical protein